jgi:hypothetical protein
VACALNIDADVLPNRKHRERVVSARRWLYAWALAAAATLAFGVTSSSAASLVANSGFETNCSGSPCSWSVFSVNGTLSRDTGTAHSGAASAKLVGHYNGVYYQGDIFSDCVNVGPGTYTGQYWYLDSGGFNQAEIRTWVAYYTAANCAGSAAGNAPLADINPVYSANWQLAGGMATLPAGTASAKLWFETSLNNGFFYLDDVDLEGQPTAVTVATAGARPVPGGVSIRWRTASEAGLLGFRIYRSSRRTWQRLGRLIRAHGAAAGASYGFVDRTASGGVAYRYEIVSVGRDGQRLGVAHLN